jgi:hypothetical protein
MILFLKPVAFNAACVLVCRFLSSCGPDGLFREIRRSKKTCEATSGSLCSFAAVQAPAALLLVGFSVKALCKKGVSICLSFAIRARHRLNSTRMPPPPPRLPPAPMSACVCI